jgi:hypothetical protein
MSSFEINKAKVDGLLWVGCHFRREQKMKLPKDRFREDPHVSSL